MRIVSWNLARNTTSRSNPSHERAWHFLAALDPDIALIQEAWPPVWASDRWTIVNAKTKYWGSAILAKPELALEPMDLERPTRWDKDGYLASGSIKLPDSRRLVLGSVHAPLMKSLTVEYLAGLDATAIKLPSYSTAFYYDVPYALFQERVRDLFIVGGDWNVSPELWDAHHRNSYEREFFERAAADGWVDCYRRFHDVEGQTWFRKNNRPYQMEHVFCDPKTADQIRSCEIEPFPAASLAVSDHAAVVLELEPI